jgi:bifunctional UDP-N-acetylglucosamine pyrophosphorylase/glucosamine-1-phosphate N-acetyltransferase
MKVAVVLLAAGQGTRMHSTTPKVLHPLCGKPMLWHTLEAVKGVSTGKPVIVVGHGAETVRAFVGDAADFAVQEPQLGTAHATMQAEALLKGKSDYIVVINADLPLLRGETVQKLVETQASNTGPITLLTVLTDDPRGFGRVVRAGDGTVEAIVEESVATPEQLQLHELNVGAYCFEAAWLWQALGKIEKNPKKGEYYLTDIVDIARGDGRAVCAVVHDDLIETIGINNRVHLAEAETAMRQRINHRHMLDGVSITDPASTYIEVEVRIGEDTFIQPNTHIMGTTVIGRATIIGPNAIIRDSTIGDHCKVVASVMEGAVLEDDVDIGPFARLRRGAHLARHVHMGNFGEVKDSYLGAGVKMGHFSYIGNATIGEDSNIGAGTITCNYDGEKKNPTEIGKDVFIGSDTMLVAPIKVGDGARTGAGAVVTKDVPPDTLVVGVPARAIKKVQRKRKQD